MPRLTKEQKAARRLGIGSSDVAELLGISPYDGASPVRLFAEKTGQLPPDDDEEESIEQEVGHALEEPMCKLYEKHSGFVVLRAGEYVESIVHPDVPWARANLDGRIKDKLAALEVKIVGIGMVSDWDLSSDDGIPDYVRVQAAWQMYVGGLDEIHVTVLCGGTHFRVFYVGRDAELEGIVVPATHKFWADVIAGKLPPLDGSSACRDFLNAKYPRKPEAVEVEAPAAVIPIGALRLRAAEVEKTAKQVKEATSNQIIEALGKANATAMTCEAWRATYQADKNGQRSLLIKPRGELKMTTRKPKPNIHTLPALPEGDAF